MQLAKRNGPFLGFVATTSQLGVRRQIRINAITRTVNKITHVFSQSENGLSSFIGHVQTELHSLNSFIASDRAILKNIIDDVESRDHIRSITEKLLSFLNIRKGLPSCGRILKLLDGNKDVECRETDD